MKKHRDERSARVEKVVTPAGFAMTASAHFRGEWGDIILSIGEKLIIQVSGHVNSHTVLRLPSDELIELSVLNY